LLQKKTTESFDQTSLIIANKKAQHITSFNLITLLIRVAEKAGTPNLITLVIVSS